MMNRQTNQRRERGPADLRLVDAKIGVAAARRDSICQQMAHGTTETRLRLMPALIEVSGEIATLRLDRDAQLRAHFYGA